MTLLLVTNKATLATIRCSASQAAELMDLEPDDILWAVGEYGRCDATNVTTNTEYVAIAQDYEGDAR
jgi:hypothetical protein